MMGNGEKSPRQDLAQRRRSVFDPHSSLCKITNRILGCYDGGMVWSNLVVYVYGDKGQSHKWAGVLQWKNFIQKIQTWGYFFNFKKRIAKICILWD